MKQEQFVVGAYKTIALSTILAAGSIANAATDSITQLKVAGVTASTNDGNLPSNAIDGNSATRWSGLGPNAYMTVDLGKTMSVSSFDTSWYVGDQRKNTFTIGASTDGTSFSTVYSGTSSGTTAGFEDYTFKPVGARYLRLTVASNSQNNWASVTDVEAYGAPMPTHLFQDTFSSGSDGLLTNEYAYWNPTKSDAKQNANWEMNSGSLFQQSNSGWSGAPDASTPNATSSNGNDSAVYRMMTKRADFQNVAVSVRLRNNGLVTTSRTPRQDWDGIHFWLRYQAEDHMYYASINRRDGTVILKKKVPGGTTNGGTYYDMGSSAKHAVPYGSWQNVKATAKNNSDGSVTIALYSEGTLLISYTDKGLGGPPITAAGKLGLRADNCNFNFDDFTVDSL
jgi:hypothetical protein